MAKINNKENFIVFLIDFCLSTNEYIYFKTLQNYSLFICYFFIYNFLAFFFFRYKKLIIYFFEKLDLNI